MKISIIGAGAMGGAIAEGLLKCEEAKAENLTVCDHNQSTMDHFASLGASVTSDNSVAAAEGDIVMVVVKPWCVEKTLSGIKDALDYKNQILVVVAAGISSEQINAWMDKGGEKPSLFLVMPNIAIAQKASMTFISAAGASQGEINAVTDVFNELGETLFMDESLFPAATAMSCGIGYAMRYVRANVEGAVEIGFKAKAAQKIVLQTIKGAVELLQASGEHPEAAIDKVTTPGGITIRGLNEMEHAGFTSAVIRGLKAGKV
ncbi:MAG TPA: pyrroline-5-carboxylate reductase [Prevotella sp.]|nr:pyrroline-5-carboxylate reductase [Prevotella sp.]